MTDRHPSRILRNASHDRVPWLVFAFITVVFLVSTHVWTYSVQDRDLEFRERRIEHEAEGNPKRRVLFTALGLYGLAGIIRSGRPRLELVGLLGSAVVFCVGWSFLSVLWTTAPALTVRRLIAFTMFGLGAVALARRLSPRNVVLLMFVTSGIYLIYSLAAEIAHGTFTPLVAGYRFFGTQHPNNSAMNFSFLVLSGLAVADTRSDLRNLGRFGALMGLIFLILTRSRTSFAATVLAVVVYRSMGTKSSKRAVAIFLVAFVLMGLLLVLGDSAAPILGKGVNLGRESGGNDATLNGRTWLWMECRGYIGRRPLQGYGFNGFWTPSRIATISQSQGWTLGSAHSMYVDLLLNLGLIGFFGFTAVIALSLSRSRAYYQSTSDRGYAFFTAFLVFYALHGTLESVFIRTGYFAFMSMVVFASLAFIRPVAREVAAVQTGAHTDRDRTLRSPVPASIRGAR